MYVDIVMKTISNVDFSYKNAHIKLLAVSLDFARVKCSNNVFFISLFFWNKSSLVLLTTSAISLFTLDCDGNVVSPLRYRLHQQSDNPWKTSETLIPMLSLLYVYRFNSDKSWSNYWSIPSQGRAISIMACARGTYSQHWNVALHLGWIILTIIFTICKRYT